jgi:hypothetical protein
MQTEFHIGQLVRLTPSPDQGGGRIYCVTRILPSGDKGGPAYLIKTMTGTERQVSPQDIKAAAANALP